MRKVQDLTVAFTSFRALRLVKSLNIQAVPFHY